MILSAIASFKESPFWPFLIENWSKNHIIGDFCCKKSSKFEENSKITIYSLVPQIDHPVALWEEGRARGHGKRALTYSGGTIVTSSINIGWIGD